MIGFINDYALEIYKRSDQVVSVYWGGLGRGMLIDKTRPVCVPVSLSCSLKHLLDLKDIHYYDLHFKKYTGCSKEENSPFL